MNKEMIIKTVLILLTITGGGCAETKNTKPLPVPQQATDINSLDDVLKNLNRQTSRLKSYQCQIEYLFSQPLFESQTLRKGVLYYQRNGQKSKLRINFQILQQDDEKQQQYIEQYIFDGAWLTHIDHQIKTVKKHQLADVNEPVDAFELVKRNLPIIGFTKTDELKNEFDITLVEQAEPADFIQLHLKTKPDSIYKDDYTSIDFWIDKTLYLPTKIIAASTEEDIYQIKLLDAKVNEEIDRQVFDIEMPDGFSEEKILLKK
ncbi:MAG: hypothetical protein KAS75_00725 [Planctomycetes bacterium]|nr:hypothetical protein [Planctomycetota bacterium]